MNLISDNQILAGAPLYMSNVNHPLHYNCGKIEVIEFIEDQHLNFARGSVIKYTARAGKKDPEKEMEDLQKAEWYIKREIERVKAEKECHDPIRPNDMNPREKICDHHILISKHCEECAKDFDASPPLPQPFCPNGCNHATAISCNSLPRPPGVGENLCPCDCHRRRFTV